MIIFCKAFFVFSTILLSGISKYLSKDTKHLSREDFNIGFQLMVNSFVVIITYSFISIARNESLPVEYIGSALLFFILVNFSLVVYVRVKCWELTSIRITDRYGEDVYYEQSILTIKGVTLPIIFGVLSLVVSLILIG